MYGCLQFEFIAPMPHAGDPSTVGATGTEPKDHPTTLLVEEAGSRATLHQSPTPHRQVESWMTYQTSGPCTVDFTFRYKLHAPQLFTRGFAGFFFANCKRSSTLASCGFQRLQAE